eukprot:6211466-Pleurochrysis_carterae.AAC.6
MPKTLSTLSSCRVPLKATPAATCAALWSLTLRSHRRPPLHLHRLQKRHVRQLLLAHLPRRAVATMRSQSQRIAALFSLLLNVAAMLLAAIAGMRFSSGAGANYALPRHLASYVRLSSSIVPAYAALLLAAGALFVLLRPLYLTSCSLLRKPARSPSQGRPEHDLFCDPAPFASALDSTVRIAVSLFAEARLCLLKNTSAGSGFTPRVS